MNYAKLEARIRELRERYDLLKQWQDIPKEEFMQDPMKNRAVIRVLQEAIEVCISIANQIVSEMNYGKPKTYAEAFEILARHNVIDDDFEKNLERMVGFRNRIIHRYWEIDLEEVWCIFQERISDFKRFESAILDFIKQLPG